MVQREDAVTGEGLEVEAAAEEACEKFLLGHQTLVLLVKSSFHFPLGEFGCEELASSVRESCLNHCSLYEKVIQYYCSLLSRPEYGLWLDYLT
jgi:hypothetical protein